MCNGFCTNYTICVRVSCKVQTVMHWSKGTYILDNVICTNLVNFITVSMLFLCGTIANMYVSQTYDIANLFV